MEILQDGSVTWALLLIVFDFLVLLAIIVRRKITPLYVIGIIEESIRRFINFFRSRE